MKYRNKVFLLAMVLFVSICSISPMQSQNLVNADWISYLCERTVSLSITTDKDGSIYYLGSIRDSANCTIGSFYEENGSHFIIKSDRNGNKKWIRQFGGTGSYNGGLVEVNSRNEIIIAVTFSGAFYFEGVEICQSLNPNPILLTIDAFSNLKHFKLFESNSGFQIYLNEIVLDDKDNIYCKIFFSDTLKFDNIVLTNLNQGIFGHCLMKFNVDNSLDWYKQFHSEGSAGIGDLDFMRESRSSVSRLIVVGGISGDSLFINGEFYKYRAESATNITGAQHFIMAISEEGECLDFQFSDPNILIKEVTHFDNNIYTMGYFNDTVYWQNQMTVADRIASLYISKISCDLEVDFFKQLSTFSRLQNVKNLIVDDQYGFLIAGSFDGEYITGIDSLFLDTDGSYGSMITNLDENYNQVSIAFLDGKRIFIRDIEIHDDGILGVANYDRDFQLDDFEFDTNKRGSFLFKTSEISTLQNFKPKDYSFDKNNEMSKYSIQVFPNPFEDYISISVNCEIGDFRVYNSVGLDVTTLIKTEIGYNEIFLDCRKLPSGMYIIQIENHTSAIKVVKVN